MRLLTVLFLITAYTLAKKRRLDQILGNRRELEARQKATHYESNEDYAKKVDEYPQAYSQPVPFGHIFKEGFEDPNSNYKQPVDLVELDTVYLKDGPRARELIQKQERKYQRIVEPELPVRKYLSPKDALSHETIKDSSDELNVTHTKFWNLAEIQQKNLYDPPKFRMGKTKPIRKLPPDVGPSNYNNKAKYFNKESFGLERDRPGKIRNFTTCDEFGRNARFHPNDIVNIDWLPFFIWTYVLSGRVAVARVHRFEYPTVKLVKKYKDEFGAYLNKTIDWEQPKLVFRDGTSEFLLIAADRRGLFDAIPYNDIPNGLKSTDAKVPMTTIRLKVVDPYLGLMYCDHQYANVMAVVGTEPKTKKEMRAEAASMKLKGKGFPIRRDTHMERMEAMAKRKAEMERAQEKFINIEEQMPPLMTDTKNIFLR